ncbi:1435_t:CDS:2 [Entrophospora sp. SA101]|nr:1435_t:CDS:2 [Entrophospora sp. SA101]
MAHWIANKIRACHFRSGRAFRVKEYNDFLDSNESSGYHYNPIGIGEKIAPDIVVSPRESLVQRENPYPGFPRGDCKGNSYARVICEVANNQKIGLWNIRCETWMQEEHVRCVFGVKLYPKINKRIVHQPIVARLWARRALPDGVLSSNATLAGNGIYVKEWECGTIYHYIHTPISSPNVEDYTAVLPDSVVGENFVIDLYHIQQIA